MAERTPFLQLDGKAGGSPSWLPPSKLTPPGGDLLLPLSTLRHSLSVCLVSHSQPDSPGTAPPQPPPQMAVLSAGSGQEERRAPGGLLMLLSPFPHAQTRKEEEVRLVCKPDRNESP